MYASLKTLNQIFKSNYPMSTTVKPTVDNIITPKDGFGFAPADAIVDQAKITATLPALNTVTVVNPEEVHVSINAVVCFHSPLTPGDDEFAVIHLSKEVPNYNFEQTYALQMDFDVLQAGIAAKYDSSILYLSVVPKTADEKILQYSGTYVKSF